MNTLESARTTKINLLEFHSVQMHSFHLTCLAFFQFIFEQISEGATYSVVPFINKNAFGSISGIAGAGGNAGAVAGMFLFKKQLTGLDRTDSFLYLGVIISCISFGVLAVRFCKQDEQNAKKYLEKTLAEMESQKPAAVAA